MCHLHRAVYVHLKKNSLDFAAITHRPIKRIMFALISSLYLRFILRRPSAGFSYVHVLPRPSNLRENSSVRIPGTFIKREAEGLFERGENPSNRLQWPGQVLCRRYLSLSAGDKRLRWLAWWLSPEMHPLLSGSTSARPLTNGSRGERVFCLSGTGCSSPASETFAFSATRTKVSRARRKREKGRSGSRPLDLRRPVGFRRTRPFPGRKSGWISRLSQSNSMTDKWKLNSFKVLLCNEEIFLSPYLDNDHSFRPKTKPGKKLTHLQSIVDSSSGPIRTWFLNY